MIAELGSDNGVIMQNTFGILGSGMQGTAAAYDLAKFAEPARIFVGDLDLAQAERSANRVNELAGAIICEPYEVDALNPDAAGCAARPS